MSLFYCLRKCFSQHLRLFKVGTRCMGTYIVPCIYIYSYFTCGTCFVPCIYLFILYLLELLGVLYLLGLLYMLWYVLYLLGLPTVGSITSRCSGKWAHANPGGGTKTGLERAAEIELHRGLCTKWAAYIRLLLYSTKCHDADWSSSPCNICHPYMTDILRYCQAYLRVCRIWKCALKDLSDTLQSAAEFQIAKSQFI